MSDEPDSIRHWSASYADLHSLPRTAFAWEFLRRNEQFHEAVSKPSRSWREVSQQGQLSVYHNPESDLSHDCLFADSADRDARTALVLWNPRCCPEVLRLVALRGTADAGGFSLSNSPLPTVLLQTGDGLQHVLIRDGLCRLQLAVQGDSLLQPVNLLVNTATEPAIAAMQDRSLQVLRAYRATGSLPAHSFPPESRAKRLVQVLEAVDGWHAGFRHRDIAIALYGVARVARDWNDPRQHMRDQVRYAIARGRSLIDHGYRAFLA